MSDSLITALEQLLRTPDPPGLDGGPRAHVASPRLLADHVDDLVRQHGLAAQQRERVQALILLWHDHLHAAHTLVQDLTDPDGALIHAILHRREPDYWNAKYWLQRVGRHPIYPRLARATLELADRAHLTEEAPFVSRDGTWLDLAFVDFAQACAPLPRDDPRRRLAVAVQEAESRLLLEHLVRPGPGRADSTPCSQAR